MGNRLLFYDGVIWNQTEAQVYDDQSQWADATSYAVWDGAEWMTALPAPVEFPQPSKQTHGSFEGVDVATLSLPDGMRLGETVVSVCASYGDQDPAPPGGLGLVELLPVRASEGVTLDPTKLHLQASMFMWEPSKGSSVSWRVSGQRDTNAVVMNLVYRDTDTTKIPAKPIARYDTAEKADEIELPASSDYTSLYVALALASDLTNGIWPEGFTSKYEEFGTFGEDKVHMLAAHTVGSKASPGKLLLDSTVDEVAVALITVPGMENPDHKGVWILGDGERSTLGTTTVLQ
ncbi:hypothetical protein [Streptomyces sp. WZ-12]|uniref:hypothetical protein n=1 Tax=Streptomyces sp. WZ-12 TaxID=3030210 RepID=UPI0023814B3F|nr:hypothetical protein [Streptomyces sp. WZ-12]